MMRLLIIFVFIVASLLLPPIAATQTAITINHQCTYLSQIPTQWVDSAKSKLRIAYGHTSHGSQLTDGMSGLVTWKGSQYSFNNGGTGGALDLHDQAMAKDVGYYPDWVNNTRTYLNTPANSDVNVIIWSWCGQVASQSQQSMIDNYLAPMTQLESDYPHVKFVYMTGHLDGSGSAGILNVRNQQIRNYCQTNKKVLFDFADIESYDPDGAVNYMALLGNDNCDYDSNGDGIRDKNWATDWQNTHTENVDWYSCSAAHSQPLNGNRKAYAAWWLWASLAGWSGTTEVEEPIKDIPRIFNISQNYPNPFNPTTTIEFTLIKDSKILLKVYNVLGQEVATLIDGEMQAGILHRVPFDASHLSSGIYFYRLEAKDNVQMKKLVLMK
jgi:hypothetical protein